MEMDLGFDGGRGSGKSGAANVSDAVKTPEKIETIEEMKSRLIEIFNVVGNVENIERYIDWGKRSTGYAQYTGHAASLATAAATIARTVASIDGQGAVQEDFSAAVKALAGAMSLLDERMDALEGEKSAAVPETAKNPQKKTIRPQHNPLAWVNI